MNDYSIVWLPIKEGSDLSRHLDATGALSLPWFLEDAKKRSFERQAETNLEAIDLLKGLLVAYMDEAPAVDMGLFRRHVPRILEDLRDFFAVTSLEILLLEAAALLREGSGDGVSFRALLSGAEILPESSKIKCDCSIDLWNLLESGEVTDTDWGFGELKRMCGDIDLDDILPHIISFVLTAQAIAEMYFKEPIDRDRILSDDRLKPEHKKVLSDLLERGEVNPEEICIE
ncbi:hypothetical protein ACFL2P_02460 [Candidatus Moduliflexota bacterium]